VIGAWMGDRCHAVWSPV